MKKCRIAFIAGLTRSGMEACLAGDLERAEENLSAALADVQVKGPLCYEARIRNNLGIVHEQKGDPDMARVHYLEALGILLAKIGPKGILCRTVEKNLARVS